MDWELLQTFVVQGNTQQFLTQVAESLQTGNKQFGILQKGLRTHCFQQVPKDITRNFVCQALLRLITENADSRTPIAHLLLEAVPPSDSPTGTCQTAIDLFSVCCCAEHARLAVKVAQIFSLELTDVQDMQQCKQFVHSLLQDKSLLTPAVGLLLHFPVGADILNHGVFRPRPVDLVHSCQQLSDGINISEVLAGLVEEGQLGLAQRWAATLPQNFQISLATHCVACDRLKEAVKLVRHLNLQQTFPDIDEMYKQRTLTRLLEKEQWAVAATYAGQDIQCQEQVVRAMALAGESALAEETREQLGLSRDTLDIDSTEAAAQRALTADTYLPLQIPSEMVFFVDDEHAIARCREVLQNVHIVGLDAEWKPNTSGEQNPISILQVATHSAVLLLDMPKLKGSEALDQCLSSLLQNAGIIKLGCRLSDDITKLHRSYPDMQAFQEAVALLDLTGPWTMYMQENHDQELQGRRKGAPVGLSNMAQSLLGKPLNKGMQTSDWERRPLSSKQLEYAALDAFVLLQIYDVISNPNTGPSPAQLQSCLYSHHALGRQHSRKNSHRNPPTDTHPALQAPSHRQPSERDSLPPVVVPTASQPSSDPSTKSSHSSSPSSTTAPSFHSQAATEACTASPAVVMQEQPGVAQQKLSGDTSRVLEGSALQGCLQSHGLQSALRVHSSLGAGSLATAASAAAALQVPQSRIANSLAFLADRVSLPSCSSSTPVVVVLRGNQRVDMRKAMSPTLHSHAHYLLCRRRCRLGLAPARHSKPLLQVADQLGCSRRALKVATPEQCCTVFGYMPGVLPPCGHACNAMVLVDQGLCSLQDLPDVQLTHQAATKSTPVDTALDPSPVQLPDTHSSLSGLGATEQMGTPAWSSHQQATSRMQCATDHTRTCPQEGLSSHMPLNSACSGTPWTEEAQLSSAAPQCSATLYCGAGQLDAYLALSFDQLLALSNGRAVHLVQSDASQASTSGSRRPVHGRPVGTDNTFLLDSMCGRLCRWLRCVGLDTELIEGDVARSQVAVLVDVASKRGRVCLTRDHKLAEQRGSGAVYLLASDDAKEQFTDIQKRFGIRVDKKKLLSRCSQCNSADIAKVDKDAIQDVVDAKVFNYVTRFWQCQECQKVFWVGPKSDAAVQNMLSLVLDGQDCQQQA